MTAEHPSKRVSREHYRPPPERLTERMAAWRAEHPFRVNSAVLLEVWRPIVDGASTHTGYTQEWPRLDVADWGWLMASVADTRWRDRAHARGWRTFRVVYDDAPEVNERECLATAHGITCVACGGCAGNADPRPTSFWIRAHGYRMGRPAGVTHG